MTGGLKRLMRMSGRELAARGLESARAASERVSFSAGRERWRPDLLGKKIHSEYAGLDAAARALRAGDSRRAHDELRSYFTRREARFPIAPAERGTIASAIRAEFPEAAEHAAARADRILKGTYDLLGYSELSFRADCDASEATPDWHFDPVHERGAPSRFWKRVPFLDPSIGDHKIIWELNRHQHWLALGRAAWLTGDERYATRFSRELRSWMRANPPLTGVNWASMLELALRSISWLWALHFFAAFEALPDDADSSWLVDLLTGLEHQLEQIARHLSVYSSPNTHLLGEGLALYAAGRILPELRPAPTWERAGLAVLLREATRQVGRDGGHAERSLHYHRYALDFYLLALVIARRTGDAAAKAFEEVVERLAVFGRTMADESGRLAAIGDDDGGQLFPICGRAPADAGDSLSLAAALLRRPDLAAGSPSEEALWMLGGDREAFVWPGGAASPESRAFQDTGFLVLRTSTSQAILDAGPHGFLNGGHAHADALSLVLSIEGQPLLIDPGTGTYTMDAAMRDRFRSTAMHNTIVVDGRCQSVPDGPFHWRSRTNARIEAFRPGVGLIEGSHDGYAPLIHRRTILNDGRDLWLIVDHLIGDGPHRMDAYWHLDPQWCQAGRRPSDAGDIGHPAGMRAAIVSTAHESHTYHGDAEGLGWCAPVYGRVIPSLTLRFTEYGIATFSIVTAIAASATTARAFPLSITQLPIAADAPDGWHRTAVLVLFNGAATIASFAAPSGATRDRRVRHRVRARGGELVTDASVALLRLSRAGEAEELRLLDGRVAHWTGRTPFAIDLPERVDELRFDPRALESVEGSTEEGTHVRHRRIR